MALSISETPELRLRVANDAPIRASGDFVLLWMIASRRTTFNFALDRAVQHARALNRPLVVLEGLRAGYPWASDRIHKFVLDGMSVNAARCADSRAVYFPYVEPEPGAGRGLLEALAQLACVVVTDEFPCFFLPNMVEAAARRLPVRLEVVDSNGLLPLRATPNAFSTAYAFRRFLQRTLPDHLLVAPTADPLAELGPRTAEIPGTILRRWPLAPTAILAGEAEALLRLPIDHEVTPAPFAGGMAAARETLDTFLSVKLDHYCEDRRHPDEDAASGLSPYLHFGHVSVYDIFRRVARRESWTPARLAPSASGSREGWWGMSPAAESFLDELVTWRELGFAFNTHRRDFDSFDSLPDWAKATLAKHADDAREPVYNRARLEAADTHDTLWNAAQTQLLREGRLHNYLRMLWGKKILEWSASPREACATMIELNNKYAVDGRNPNSYSGIFWVLGRYDRPWSPERPVYGVVRFMSSANTMKKLRAKEYLKRWSAAGTAAGTASTKKPAKVAKHPNSSVATNAAIVKPIG